MLFEPDAVGFYLDWRSQEVAVAAALFGDERLRAEYKSGDIYHALALMCGITKDQDPFGWKANHRPQRDRMKPIQLGINYGMGVPSLAKSLGRHPLIASEIISLYARKHPKFWRGRLNVVEYAMQSRELVTSDGWPLRITHTPNQRSLLNHPMQAGGALMLREATLRLVDAGITPIMLVHDGILFSEMDPRRIPEAIQIMRDVGSEVCHGIEVGVDLDWCTLNTTGVTIDAGTNWRALASGDRGYRDKRDMAKKMWATIMEFWFRSGRSRRRHNGPARQDDNTHQDNFLTRKVH
jgi:DNA polymerase I-like protein with 3'-5' exonuclease and polymerase domains